MLRNTEKTVRSCLSKLNDWRDVRLGDMVMSRFFASISFSLLSTPAQPVKRAALTEGSVDSRFILAMKSSRHCENNNRVAHYAVVQPVLHNLYAHNSALAFHSISQPSAPSDIFCLAFTFPKSSEVIDTFTSRVAFAACQNSTSECVHGMS